MHRSLGLGVLPCVARAGRLTLLALREGRAEIARPPASETAE